MNGQFNPQTKRIPSKGSRKRPSQISRDEIERALQAYQRRGGTITTLPAEIPGDMHPEHTAALGRVAARMDFCTPNPHGEL